MKAMAQSFPYEFSKAKKVVASVVAAALVISFGNFALGGGKAIADDGTVEVRFNITAPGAKVTLSTGEEFTAESDDNLYQALTNEDLTFTAETPEDMRLEVTHNAPEPAEPQAQAMGSKQPSDNLVIGEPSIEDGSKDASPEEEAATEPEAAPIVAEPVVEDEAIEPIPQTAEVLKQKAANGEEPIIVGQPEGTEAEAEVVEDDATPMAATPLADTGAEAEVVETVAVPDENGVYTIPAAALAAAAEQGTTIVVTIADAAPGTINSWDELTRALTADGTADIKLNKDLTAEGAAITVVGTKTLDLNGYDITAADMDNLFTVVQDVEFTITDTSAASAAKEITVDDPEFDGQKIPNPAVDREGFEKMVGKKAVWDPEFKTLQYYVTKSYTNRPVKGQTEEYLYEYKVDLSAAGAIEVNEGKTLVQVNGGTLNVQGGRLTLIEGEHAIAMDGGTLTMSEHGFLVGSEGTNGAAINAQNNAMVTIEGDSIIAGNTAAGDNNGGAIWVDKSILTIQGEALLAANQAGEKVYKVIDYGTMSSKNNGGAVYVQSESTVTVSENAVVSGNTAMADGGGLYIMGRLESSNQAENSLSLTGNAVITNNRSENDKSDFHFTERTHASSEVKWRRYGGGGGGVFSMDHTSVNGAQFTGNYASDGGGGLMIYSYATYDSSDKKLSQYIYPLLEVKKAVFASNYAGTSEGGGLHAITHKDSYIKRGYITNNMTATPFDYGGGGLFLSSATHGEKTGLTVIYPLVANNTARGFGGGVGVCTNGIAVTADAAIFDNTALTENATTNPNEFGDQWAYDELYGLKDIAKRQEVEGVMQSQADDFFCAKESVVYNKMLGDENSYYNWTGLTDGYTFKGSISAVREGGNSSANKLIVNGEAQPAPPNALYNKGETTADLHIYDGDGEARNFDGYLVTVTVKNIANSKFPTGTYSGVVTNTNRTGLSYSDPNNPNYEKYKGFYNYMLKLNTNLRGDLAPNATLKGAYTKPDKKDAKNYPMYQVSDMAQTEGSFAKGERLMFLKANPTPKAKEAAVNKAVLFVTGNYSNTNGGGIACNDRIAIGRDPEVPEIPDQSNSEEPKNHTAALTLTKSLDKFDAASGSATAVFNVTGYIDKISAEKKVKDLVVYANTIGLTFNAATGEQSLTEQLTNLPEGYYVIEEAFYSGDGFETKADRWAGWVKFDPAENSTDEVPVTIPVEVSFENTFDDEDKSFGTGVVNKYADENGTLTWAPDSNYNARQQALEEGRQS